MKLLKFPISFLVAPPVLASFLEQQLAIERLESICKASPKIDVLKKRAKKAAESGFGTYKECLEREIHRELKRLSKL